MRKHLQYAKKEKHSPSHYQCLFCQFIFNTSNYSIIQPHAIQSLGPFKKATPPLILVLACLLSASASGTIEALIYAGIVAHCSRKTRSQLPLLEEDRNGVFTHHG